MRGTSFPRAAAAPIIPEQASRIKNNLFMLMSCPFNLAAKIRLSERSANIFAFYFAYLSLIRTFVAEM